MDAEAALGADSGRWPTRRRRPFPPRVRAPEYDLLPPPTDDECVVLYHGSVVERYGLETLGLDRVVSIRNRVIAVIAG